MTDSETASGGPVLEPKLVDDLSGRFFVPSYQRGYRWGRDEVRRLLDDIAGSRGREYFLQPVVVKKMPDGRWELVDGQQRLTTLYLILRYIKPHLQTLKINYTLEYETRADSARYLESPTEAESQRNIDFFHIFEAFRCVRDWFENQPNSLLAAYNFYASLCETVSVIWYEAPTDVDSATLFTRLNVGRIPLTDAELVKALVLARSRSANGHVDRALEIAAQWDTIERDLRVPEVWAFVTGSAETDATHIGLLLDRLAGGPMGRERPLFHTFETLRPRIEADPQGVWNEVVDLHSLVMGWYSDRNLYHKVGYLIATSDATKRARQFDELVELSRNRTKSNFEAALDDRIRDRLSLSEESARELTYQNAKSYRLLLLHNVETVRCITDSSERYSFRAQASQSWSLEHIHAQNAEQLNRAEQWTEWLRLHRVALAALNTDDRRDFLIASIDQELVDVTQDGFRRLQREVGEYFTSHEETEDADIDSISNLALLDSPTNSALSNAVFEVKRRQIIDRDRSGGYIPLCTRNVFLKYYTPSGSQQLHYWSSEDRNGYLHALLDTVRPYLVAEETAK